MNYWLTCWERYRVNDEERFKTPVALLSGRAMGNHWKASHDYIHVGPLSGGNRRDVFTMTDNNNNNENLKEIELTLNIRILLNDKDMDKETYQETFNHLLNLNRC